MTDLPVDPDLVLAIRCFLGSPVAIALHNTLPEYRAPTDKLYTLVKFIRNRFDLPRFETSNLAA
jgi:hypothetical protein